MELDLLMLPVVIVKWIWNVVEGLGSSSWPLTQGTINSARAVVQQEGRRTHWIAEFSYWYKVEGEYYDWYKVEGEYYAGYYILRPYGDFFANHQAKCR